jgi:ATP-binding cassette subfamily B protein/subfamily B ATP-binding cassette protein MsbA
MFIETSRRRYQEFRRTGNKNPESEFTIAPEKLSKDPKLRKKYLRNYWYWLKPFRRRTFLLFSLALVAAMLSMAVPMLTKNIIDGVLLNETRSGADRASALFALGLAMVTLIGIAESIEYIRGYGISLLNSRVIFRLRKLLYDRMLRLPLEYLSNMKSGGIVSRLSGDVDNVSGLLQTAIISPGVAIIRIVLTIGILFYLSWQLALAAATLIPLVILLNFAWIRKVRPIYRAMREDQNLLDARSGEAFSGIRVVRAFRRERKEARDYGVGHHGIIRKNLLAQRMQLVVSCGWGLVIPMTSVVVVWYGGHLYLQGKSTIGEILAFQMYILNLLHPVSQLVFSFSTVQRGLASLERVFDIIEQPPDKPDRPHAMIAPQDVERITLENVTFQYVENRPVISDISLEIPGATTVALVGPSGGGKTTLTDLVARFIDPTRGVIRLNGIDLRDFQLQSYRQLMAVVPQDVFLFDGTVRDNIAYGRRKAKVDAVIEAARRAHAHEFISEMPKGYDTLIGERGVKLSGGQRQRLSIARAILADPRILILDEATSNLDTESEQYIQQSMIDLFANRTTFLIAHRLSTVVRADLIVVLDAGCVVETGRHEELLAKQGMYYEMVARQGFFACEPMGET